MTNERPATVLDRVIGALAMALWTALRSLQFSGRSRRTELACYWLVGVVLVTALASEVARLSLDWQQARIARFAIEALAIAPLFALMARRFHDMGYTGWLVLPAFPTWALGLSKDYWYRFTPDVIAQPYPLDGAIQLLGLPGIIVLFCTLVQEGQEGANRYGADPRRLGAAGDAKGESAIG